MPAVVLPQGKAYIKRRFQMDYERHKVLRVSLEELSERTLRQWAELYCAIWREPPWNEDFWTVEGVIDDIKQQMAKPCAEAFLGMTLFHQNDPLYIPPGFVPVPDSWKVTGFTWGYRVGQEELRQISGTQALDSLFDGNGDVFYVDELGVAAAQRSQGVGRELSEKLLRAAKDHGCRRITLRTHVDQQAARALYSKLGFRELGVRDIAHPDRSYWLK